MPPKLEAESSLPESSGQYASPLEGNSPGPAGGLPGGTGTGWRRSLGRRGGWIVPTAIFAVLLMVGSALATPPPDHFYPSVSAGPPPIQTVYLWNNTPFTLTFSGGEVSSTNVAYYYHLFWFFGDGNGTGNYDVVSQAVVPPASCVITANCAPSTVATVNHIYNRTGSFDVSVTIYDGQLDYTIYTFVVHVVAPPFKLVQYCQWAPKNSPYAGQIAEFWYQGEFTSNLTPYRGLTYTYNWGDGSSSLGIFYGGCYGGGFDGFAQHRWSVPGPYLVTLTATDPRDGQSARIFFWQNVTNPQPIILYTNVPATATVNSPFVASACISDSNGAVVSNLTVIWNFGTGPDIAVNTARGVLSCSGLDTVQSSVSFAYTTAKTYTYTLKVLDPWGDAAIPSTGSITAVLTATANRTTTLTGTIGSAENLNVAMLTSLATPDPNLSYTWATGSARSHGPQDPVIGYRPGTQNTTLWVNSSGSAVVRNTQAIAWSDPAPSLGVTAFYVSPTVPLTLTMGTANCWYTVTGQVTIQGQIVAQGSITSPQLVLSLVLPTQIYLGQLALASFTYAPNLGGSCAHQTVPGTLMAQFSGKAAAPVVHSFVNGLTNTYYFLENLLAMALGQTVGLSTAVFSPAQVGLNVTWAWGDGTTNGTYSVHMPSSPSPTAATISETHQWKAGKNYTLTVTVSDGKFSKHQLYKIYDYATLAVNDTAPSVGLPAASTYVGEPVTLTATVSESNPLVTHGTPTWTLGDSSTATGTSVTHTYLLGAKYVAAVSVSSPNGSTAVAWAYVTVLEPAPSANFTLLPKVGAVDLPIRANGTRSSEDGWSSVDLSYLWSWGDGSQQAGGGFRAVDATHEFARAGNYTINLTVMNSEGGISEVSHVLPVSPLSLAATLPNIRVTADQFQNLTPTFLSFPQAERPFVNVTWVWGDSLVNPQTNYWDIAAGGIVAGHTWTVPGNYTVTATITDVHGGTPTHPSATVTVVEPVPILTSNYVGGIVAGENHTSLFHAMGLGSWADSQGYAPGSWNFTWQWGDGSGPTLTKTTKYIPWSTPMHPYFWSGPVGLNLSLTVPWPAHFASGGAAWRVTLILDPDWDGDGLPNAYETGISHTNPGLDQTNGPPGDQGPTGYGLTDFLASRLALGNLSDDPDGDGLSSLQELLGSVTGFPSNPLDPNTNGDGVMDGAHYATDTFPSAQVASLPTTATTSYLTFPNVGYYGPQLAFNTSELTLIFDTATPGALTNLQMTLYAADGNYFSLPDPTTNQATYYLLNMTPFGPAVSPLGLSLNDFTQPGTWTLVINTWTNVPGNVTAASISDTYHTDPVHADPLFQGLLEGHGLTTAIYNCSEPSNANYTAFNQASMKFHSVDYWPYTETYYKLSVLQGVPYVTGNSASIWSQNEASGRCPANMDSLEGHTASYLGDADFGISPWVAHAAGDAALTNGMKALGATNYTLTAGQFETYPSGTYAPAPTAASYLPDPLETKTGNPDYQLPLNPTAYSTSGSGVADSAAADPLHILGLALTIGSSVDPQNVCSLVSPTYIVEAQVLNWSTGTNPTYYSLTATATGAGGCNTGDSASYSGSSFTLPLDNTQPTFTVQLDLWQTGTLGPESSHDTEYISGSLTSTGQLTTGSTAIYATAQVEPLQRVPVLFLNTTNEILNLPGYGERFVGDANGFDAFYVNWESAPVPTNFQLGLNIILESMAALAQSSFNSTLVTSGSGGVPNGLGCFSSMTVTTRSSNPSPGGINQTWSGNFTGSQQSCGATLLSTLTPTGVGRLSVLGTDALERLGLSPSVLSAVPLEPILGFTDTGGGPASNWIQSTVNAIVGALTFLLEVILAGISLIASLATDLANWFVQSILGAFSAAVAGAEAIAHAIEQIVSWLVQAIIHLLMEAGTLIENFFVQMATLMAATAAGWELSFAYDSGIITTVGEYDADYVAVVPHSTPPAPISLSSVESDWTNLDTALLVGGGAVIVGFAIANAAATALSAGVDEGVEITVAKLIENAIESDLSTNVQALAQVITSALVVAFISDIASGSSSEIQTGAQDIGLGLNAANQLVTWASAINDYGTWQLVKGSNFASAYLFSMVLDFAAAIVSAIGYLLLTVAHDNSAALFFGVIGLILAGVSFGYQLTLASDTIGTFLFPLGPALYATTAFSLGSAGYTVLTAD